ncbi:MAG: acetolactate synthase large subunit [Silvibacterium sp.]|nr:acetolactate synthase large subunit [Silvibacterium sp.]
MNTPSDSKRTPCRTGDSQGARRLASTLRQGGVDHCFANPGTTEIAILTALEAQNGMKVVLCLSEGVVTGAADGFGRMSGRPALTLMHCGPGFANGVANLHNARRACSPIVNLIGDHPDWHAIVDPPLASDVESLARPVSDWVRRASSAETVAYDAHEALSVASRNPGRVATLIVPSDCQWSHANSAFVLPPPSTNGNQPALIADQRIRRFTRLLEQYSDRAVLLLGGGGLSASALESAARIASHTGVRLMCTGFPARMEQGGGLPQIERIPYIAAAAEALFEDVELVVLAGTPEPVRYFADETRCTRLIPEHVGIDTLATSLEAVDTALEQLANQLRAHAFKPSVASPVEPPRGRLSGHTVALALAATLTEQAVVVDEGVSIAGSYLRICEGTPRHSYLSLTGGACGQGLPLAVGASIASPERRVVAIVGDGSAMYTIQALWTQAKHALDITTVIYANDGYRILEAELTQRMGVTSPSVLFGKSSIDWTGLARSFGVPASRADTAEELVTALREAMARTGPTLIEARATQSIPVVGGLHG